MLEWELLDEALQRVTDVGVSVESAKREICDHVSQDLIRVRVFPENSRYSLKGRLFVDVPELLKPDDLDWVLSCPKGRWGIDPSGLRAWEPTKISLLQLKPFDTDYRLCEPRRGAPSGKEFAAPERESASSMPALKKRSRGRSARAEEDLKREISIIFNACYKAQSVRRQARCAEIAKGLLDDASVKSISVQIK